MREETCSIKESLPQNVRTLLSSGRREGESGRFKTRLSGLVFVTTFLLKRDFGGLIKKAAGFTNAPAWKSSGGRRWDLERGPLRVLGRSWGNDTVICRKSPEGEATIQ